MSHESCTGAEVSKAEDVAELLSTISNAIVANYSKIKSASLSVDDTTINLNPAKLAGRTPDGNAISLSFPAKVSTSWKLSLDGDRLRCDIIADDPEAGFETFVCGDNNIWTQYKSEMKTAWLRLPSQMNGISIVDVRNFGSPSFSESLAEVLATQLVGGILIDDTLDNAVIRLATDGPAGKYTWTLDPKRNYLPIRRSSQYPDGTRCDDCEIEYQQVLDGKAWLVSLFQQSFYYDVGSGAVLTNGNWSQRRSIAVTVESVNEPLEKSLFSFEFPPGTNIRDQVQQQVTAIKDKNANELAQAKPLHLRTYLFIVNAMIIGILLLAWLVKIWKHA